MKKYHYPAVFEIDNEGMINIYFPDLNGCNTFAETIEEAYENAEDVLALYLLDLEEKKIEIPKPGTVKIEKQSFYIITADTYDYRLKYDNKAVRKTVSLPSWMNKFADEKNINCSKLLQAALKVEFNKLRDDNN